MDGVWYKYFFFKVLIILYYNNIMWYETFDSAFWITIITIITGSIGLMLKYCLKSKCDSVSCCWGGITIHRNVEIEINDIERPTRNESKLSI